MITETQGLIRTRPEYLAMRLAEAGVRTRVLVWDSERTVARQTTVTDARGRDWDCLPFDGDATALLRVWLARPPGARILVVASPPIWGRDRTLDLSFPPELVAELEWFIDLRLHRVLMHCCPDVSWQPRVLEPLAGIIGADIQAAVKALEQLRQARLIGNVGNRTVARAVALAVALPGEPPAAFLPLPGRTPWATLADYLRRALDPRTPESALPHLLALARDEAGHGGGNNAASRSALSRVLDLEPARLGAAVLVLALTSRRDPFEASQALDAVFGPGSEPLTALKGLRPALLAPLREARSFVEMLDERSPAWVDPQTLADSVLGAPALQAASLPAALDGLPPHAFEALSVAVILREGEAGLQALLRSWVAPPEWRVPESPGRAALSVVFSGLAAVLRAIGFAPPEGGVQAVAAAWASGNLCQAEAWLSALRSRYLPEAPASIQPILGNHIDSLRQHLSEAVERWDRQLVGQLSSSDDLTAYHTANFSLAHALPDMRPSHLPEDAALFLVVMDGMRCDVWRAIARPLFEREFIIEREEWRLATLPTITRISRAAFFAGGQPDHWRGPSGSWTSQERDLIVERLGLTPEQRAQDFLYTGRGVRAARICNGRGLSEAALQRSRLQRLRRSRARGQGQPLGFAGADQVPRA